MRFLTKEEIAAKVLPPNGVEVWKFGYHSLDVAGVLFLAKCLLPQSQSNLRIVNVSDNRIDAAGATALAASLKTNRTLTRLNVGRNPIGARGATALAASLEENSTLTSLYVYESNVASVGATALAASLEKNLTLMSLDVRGNNIGDSGATALAASLEKNTTLTSLNVARNGVGEAGSTALAASLKKNTALTSLCIWDNRNIRGAVLTAMNTALDSNRSQPTWKLALNLRTGGGQSSMDAASGALCIAAPSSLSLARLLNEVFAKVGEHLRSSSGSCTSRGFLPLKWRRQISRLQLRLLGGKSLEPFACGADDPAVLRRGKCQLSAPFVGLLRNLSTDGSPKVLTSTGNLVATAATATPTPTATAATATSTPTATATATAIAIAIATSIVPMSSSVRADAADFSGGAAQQDNIHTTLIDNGEKPCGHDVYLAVSFDVVCVSFVFAVEQNSRDAIVRQVRYHSNISTGTADVEGSKDMYAPRARVEASRGGVKRQCSSERAGALGLAAGNHLSRRKRSATSHAGLGNAPTVAVSIPSDTGVSSQPEGLASAYFAAGTPGAMSGALLTVHAAAVQTTPRNRASSGVYGMYAVNGAIPLEVKTLLFAFCRS